MRPYPFACAVSALVVLALSGCAHSPPTRLYTLEPAPPAAGIAVSAPVPPVRVNAVHLPPSFDRDEILMEIAPGELRIQDLDHWAAPLSRMARQTLTEDLVARMPSNSVIYPNAQTSIAADGLSIDILSLKVGGGEAVMEVAWTHSVKTADAPSQTSVTLHRDVVGSDPAAIARAISQLLGDLADRLTLELLHR